jgi:glycosyltransferase involved in cell wall biosynthesis
VLLHASVAEAFGNVMLEAQAMMLPVVCTNAGGLPEAVADGQTAIVVPRRDSRALADALLRLARDPEERQRLGAAGRRRTLEHFTQTAHAGRFDAFYRKVLGSPPA